jgi:hypothetical protein
MTDPSARGRATETTRESLEERIARLSISIGTYAARARDARDRALLLANAREEVIEELVERGYPLHEAAIIADDIIDGADKLVSELNEHVHL